MDRETQLNQAGEKQPFQLAFPDVADEIDIGGAVPGRHAAVVEVGDLRTGRGARRIGSTCWGLTFAAIRPDIRWGVASAAICAPIVLHSSGRV